MPVNDNLAIQLVSPDGEIVDHVLWPEARERLEAIDDGNRDPAQVAETTLTAIFTGSASGGPIVGP